MATILDVAKYILRKQEGEISTWKLQKLCYYSQAWSLVWDERPLFPEDFQAWANGPVCPQLYAKHKGRFSVEAKNIPGNPDALDAAARETIDEVLKFYGQKTGAWLSDLTHLERPWLETRGSLVSGESSTEVIRKDLMFDYYSWVSSAGVPA